MKANFRAGMILVLTGVLWLASGTAQGLELRFTPAEQNIDVGAAGSLAIWLDDQVAVRTIEVTVTYDASLLEGTGGHAGVAFQDLGCFIWEEFTPEPGQWYGFAVSMGADCFISGPGELFTWDFTGLASGTAGIETVSVTLFDNLGTPLADVTLPGTTVIVGNGIAPAGDFPGPNRPVITASPNPCNPRTNIDFWLPRPGLAQLAVYDLKGRRVRRLLEGAVSDQWTRVAWDGRNDSGQSVPSGVYLYRLIASNIQLTGQVTLAR